MPAANGAAGLAAELEAAIGSNKRGDLYEGEDAGLFDGGGGCDEGGEDDKGGSAGQGTNKRKRTGALGGRLRKKLARQRAAAKAQGPAK